MWHRLILGEPEGFQFNAPGASEENAGAVVGSAAPLKAGYCFGVRSERRLCDEIHLNLADGRRATHGSDQITAHDFASILKRAPMRAWAG
ncbi:MAG TPA: hypothetical protein VMB83_11545 [Roseiarcus sp.]|nr:hypothetical protein [Roseiarcus sp.]